MKRSPERIPEILEQIRRAWELLPDQRLCQLLSNVAKMSGRDNPDLFYLEDERLAEALRAIKFSE